jgi:hypothetical protein
VENNEVLFTYTLAQDGKRYPLQSKLWEKNKNTVLLRGGKPKWTLLPWVNIESAIGQVDQLKKW